MRNIRDKFVTERCIFGDLPIEPDIKNDILYSKEYDGEVAIPTPKVSIEKNKYGLLDCSAIASLKKVYNGIQLKDGNCYVAFRESNYPVEQWQLKLLKALVIAQLNKNIEYSAILTHAFNELTVMFVMQGKLRKKAKANDIVPANLFILDENVVIPNVNKVMSKMIIKEINQMVSNISK